MQKNENVVTYISKIEMISKQLNDLGEKMLNSSIMAKIICTLPTIYENVFDAWDNTPTSKKNLNNLHAKLQKKEALKKA
jgi:hypothetical protein